MTWADIQKELRRAGYKCERICDPEDPRTRCVRPGDEQHDMHVNGYGDRFIIDNGKVQVLA